MVVIDTVAMPWEPLANGLAIKRLRTDPKSGGSSAILRAPARRKGVSRPHYHDADETILNLGAPMRFEPGPWIKRFGYSHYPAGVTHGFDVDLPEGYEVFVHTTGQAEPIFHEATPLAEPGAYVRIDDPAERPWVSAAELGGTDGARLKVFQRSAEGLVGLVALAPGGRWTVNPRPRDVELLILEGSLHTDQGPLGPGGFLQGLSGDEIFSAGGALVHLRLA